MSRKERAFNLLRNRLDTDITPDPNHRDRLREQMLAAFADSEAESDTLDSTWPSHPRGSVTGKTIAYWRTIMSSRISRYVAVAALAAVVMMGVTFLGGRSGRPGAAWAIEQTIQALQEIRTIHCRGVMKATHEVSSEIPEGKYLEIPFELWAKASEGSKPGDFVWDMTGAEQFTLKDENGSEPDEVRPDPGIRQRIVKLGNVAYVHKSKKNVVQIEDGKDFTAFDPWPGPDWFRNVKSHTRSWQEDYGKDPQTGRDSVFVSCIDDDGAKLRLQFDLETKLPVSIQKFPQGPGRPGATVDRIEYNVEIPEGKFEFTIPPGAKVVDGRQNKEE